MHTQHHRGPWTVDQAFCICRTPAMYMFYTKGVINVIQNGLLDIRQWGLIHLWKGLIHIQYGMIHMIYLLISYDLNWFIYEKGWFIYHTIHISQMGLVHNIENKLIHRKKIHPDWFISYKRKLFICKKGLIHIKQNGVIHIRQNEIHIRQRLLHINQKGNCLYHTKWW